MRIPGVGQAPRPRSDGTKPWLAALPGDRSWVPLLELLACRVGEPLVALSEPHGDGSVVYRQSTRVQHISRIDPREAEQTRPTR